MKKILHNLALILTILFLLALVFIAITKSIHAQDKDRELFFKNDSIMCIIQTHYGDSTYTDTICWLRKTRKVVTDTVFKEPFPPAQQYDNSFVPLAKFEIVCDKKTVHGKNILITKEYTALNKKMLSNFSINKYIVSDDVYYFVKVRENFDVVSLKKFFKKSRITKIIKRL